MLTEENYNILKKYERSLYSIKYAGYARTDTKDWEELAPVYENTFGRKLTATQLKCGECKKKALKLLAQAFYEYVIPAVVNNLDSKKKETTPTEEEKVEEETTIKEEKVEKDVRPAAADNSGAKKQTQRKTTRKRI